MDVLVSSDILSVTNSDFTILSQEIHCSSTMRIHRISNKLEFYAFS